MGFGRSRFSISRGAVLAALFLAGTAFAAERGGALSPFAVGAGARALALGGAYVAVADGPDAPVWNPAGLAAGQRKAVSFFYTAPFVEGNRYSYVGYVHPFLDFGCLGVGNLRYGMDGIEKYDAGGEALGTFSNVQNEWIVSYALPPFGPLSLGAALKAETQALDGETATGFGVDLGLLVRSEDPPDRFLSRRNFALGLALRNAVEPTLTLLEGEDRLPGLLRAGVAYRGAASGAWDGFLLTAQIDEGRESGGSFRFGAEYDVVRGLALRSGFGPDEWTTGIGLAAVGGRFDYSFSVQELGTAHRLGVTYAFGSSLESLREEHRAREQATLEERTQTELRRKERGQFDASLREGDGLLASGDYGGAEAAYERALLWDPENEDALHRLSSARIERHIAAGERFRDDGDLLEAVAEFQAALTIDPDEPRAERLTEETRDALDRTAARNRQVGDRLTRGVEYLALSEFIDAREAFDEALHIDPENEDAKRFLARTDSLIALRVDAMVEDGNWYRDRGNADGAAERYKEALRLRPDRDDLVREIARLETAAPAPDGSVETEAAAAPSEPARPLTADERAEAERMYPSGLDAFRAGRYPEAIRYFEFVYGLSPGYENVESYLKQACLFSGMDRYTAGDLAGAIQTWERVLEIDPSDEKALSYVRRARSEIRKTQDLSGGTP